MNSFQYDMNLVVYRPCFPSRPSCVGRSLSRSLSLSSMCFSGARVPKGVMFSDARVPIVVLITGARVPEVVVLSDARVPNVVVISDACVP